MSTISVDQMSTITGGGLVDSFCKGAAIGSMVLAVVATGPAMPYIAIGVGVSCLIGTW